MVALVASEYAHRPTILTTWWALLLPVTLIVAVFGAAPIDWYYERVPEDIQASVVFGASFGLVLGATALVLRRAIDRHRDQRRASASSL